MAETSSITPRATQLRRRLLLDIDELTRKPYPNIQAHAGDDLDQLCLVLTPPGWPQMHLQVTQLQDFPMRPPRIQMDTSVNHPNVFSNYICATILNDDRYFTPAYTLKGIAIQLLSFFGSDSIEQAHGGGVVDLERFRRNQQSNSYEEPFAACERCGFAIEGIPTSKYGASRYRDAAGVMQVRQDVAPSALAVATPNKWSLLGMERERAMEREIAPPGESRRSRRRRHQAPSSNGTDTDTTENGRPSAIQTLPNELLLQVLEALDDFEDLTSLARAWPRVSALITEHDVIRQRELQCFVTKKTYRDEGVKLGVGVSTSDRGELASEFELLSQQAFALPVRMSVQNIPFTRWLPLPLSRRHWVAVRPNAQMSLSLLQGYVKLPNPTHAQVLYSFMNDIVVKLNLVDAESPSQKKQADRSYGRDYGHTRFMSRDTAPASSLEHASEKAIESYFHLFHLLVCLATEHPEIVREADSLVRAFLAGRRDKTHCPNLGHLLVALLVSSVPVTDELRRAIITEAITRNVVWLLNPAGRRHGRGGSHQSFPELAYLEPDAVSAYRLDRTFQGSRTSYRLLMFSELFRRTARPSASSAGLAQVRDDLFRRPGAPPPGAAARLAAEVRRLHAVDDFPAFLREMGLSANQIPTPARFTGVLRGTVEASMRQGYSRWALGQADALALRMAKGCEPGVGIRPELAEMVANALYLPEIRLQGVNFFPESNRGSAAGRGGGSRGVGAAQSTTVASSSSTTTTTTPAWTADAGAGRGNGHQRRGGISVPNRFSRQTRR